jgi:asparagine synthase (glutamine-hydrolysing)
MCGWVGAFGAEVPLDALHRAGDTLATRGPDAFAERAVGADGARWPFGVAHRRLSIIDLSPTGAQPMVDDERGVTLVYNGELYNSPGLRVELQAKGHRFRGTSDTEVLLRGWIEWGDAVLDRIEGIFSFALVDQRDGRALLARDRLGVKPLYWAVHDGVLYAGSAPRALIALQPALARAHDRVAMAQFLTLLWIPHPRTPWAAIHKLPPAHALSFDGTTTRSWSYWAPPAAGARALAGDELLTTIRAATDRQLLSDVPVGLLFSGGLDSTILLELMTQHYGDAELAALTAGFDATSQKLEMVPDDTRYAREVAAAMPEVQLTEVEIDLDAERDLDALSPFFDDPVADPAAITLHRLCQASPHKVLLSGVGGEELWAGYPRHGNLGVARRAAALPQGLRRALVVGSPALLGATPGPAYARRRNVQKLVRAVGDQRPPHYWRMMAQLTFDELASLVPGAANRAYDELDAQTTPLRATSLADALAFDRAQFLPNLNLAYVDKASMATSVEVRVPLLDEVVVRPTYGAAADSFIVDGTTKVPLRTAARGVVPDAIIDRPKSGFGGPARAWFQGAPGDRLGERIDALADAGLVSRRAGRKIHRTAASGRADVALAAWALVCLQSWHEHHG